MRCVEERGDGVRRGQSRNRCPRAGCRAHLGDS